MSKYSVFGGNGFIGKYVCLDDDFIPVDRLRFDSPTNKIVYLISTVHNYHIKDDDPYIDIETNLTRLMEVLNVNRIKYNGDFEITFVSSWFVYGKTECPASEDSVCNPTGFYSITKYAAEKLLASYCDTYGIPYKIVRLANVLGAGDTKVSARKNALQYMIKTLCEGGSINLYEEDCYRDYIHVTDAAEAIRVVARDGVSSETYNAGSGTRSSIHTIIRTVHEMTGNRGIINLIPTPNFHKQVQVRDMWMDTHKIDWELGWSPKVGLSDIIKGLVSEYK